MTNSEFLAELPVYPSSSTIDEANNSAQIKATEYVQSIDSSADVTVNDSEVYIKSDILDEDQILNAQVIFDEEFSDIIMKDQENNA